MKLFLQNGYPMPYPADAPESEQEAINEKARGTTLEIAGVTSFQWLHTVTVGFETVAEFLAAQQATGWKEWSPMVLEATTSEAEGYEHPAIIAGGLAYCGFILVND